MAKRRKQPKSDSTDISVGNISNVNGSVINIGNGNVNDGDISPQLSPPLPRNGDEILPSEDKGKKKDNRTTIIVAVIGGLAVCIAAIISLGEPLVAKIVEIYFPGPTHTPTTESIVTPTLAPPLISLPPIDPVDSEPWTWPKDNMNSIYIPAGEFLMGAAGNDHNADADEKPQHTVYLNAYWIDQTEVTNEQYARCVAENACQAPSNNSSATHDVYYNNSEFGRYPVIFVSWSDANDYCTWAGRQLPTEAQWEKAAQGGSGQIYPWGNSQPNHDLANYESANKDVSMVGTYPSGNSHYIVMDMAGNVWEWTADWYNKTYYGSPESLNNPTGPIGGTERVKRGGSWGSAALTLRTSYRDKSNPADQFNSLGFRCVYNVVP